MHLWDLMEGKDKAVAGTTCESTLKRSDNNRFIAAVGPSGNAASFKRPAGGELLAGASPHMVGGSHHQRFSHRREGSFVVFSSSEYQEGGEDGTQYCQS